MSAIDDLIKLLGDAKLEITFDMFRDVNKGCGPHCKAWERSTSNEYCENHKAAIARGEYKERP